MRDDVANRFLELVDIWLGNPDTNCPHIFSLIFEQLENIRAQLGGFKDCASSNYSNVGGLLRFGARHTSRIDDIFQYIEAGHEPQKMETLSFKFATRNKGSLTFFPSGSFFEKVFKDYVTGVRREIQQENFTLVFDGGEERNVKTEEVLNYQYLPLKTQSNHSIRFSNFSLGDCREPIQLKLQQKLDEFALNSTVETLVSANYSRGACVIAYVCMVTHRYYVCECFKAGEGFWQNDLPRQAKEKGWSYRKAICHLCTKTVPEQKQSLTYVYDSTFKSTYNPWIYFRASLQLGKKFRSHSQEVLEAVTRNLQAEVDWGEWKNEKFLYLSLSNYFKERHEVLYQAHPKFLGRPSYDVFIPSIRIAVEYDGEQHYNENTYFAKKSDFQKIQERDRTKDELSAQNGVKLIRVRRGFSLKLLVEKIESEITKISKTS